MQTGCVTKRRDNVAYFRKNVTDQHTKSGGRAGERKKRYKQRGEGDGEAVRQERETEVERRGSRAFECVCVRIQNQSKV